MCPPRAPPRDLHPGAEGRAQPLLGGARVRILAGAAGGTGSSQLRHPPLDLAHGEPPAGRFAPERHLVLGPVEGEERAAVPGVERPRRDHLAQLSGQAEQAESVGDGGAVPADPARDLLLGERELALQAVKGLGLLERR